MENSATFSPLIASSHAQIKVHFSKNSDDFVVRERPLYEFSGSGEHLILQIAKKDLTTREAIKILSEQSGAKTREFGYAGLKDKEGYTTQFISLPAKFEGFLARFKHDKIDILSTNKHANKLRIGHLKGNSFFIRLKKVSASDALRLEQAVKNIDKNGFPNYFGYQRFGKFGDNAQAGLAILNDLKIGKKSKFDPRIRDFLISAFQSDLFNRWLSKRVEISRFAGEFSARELSQIYKIPAPQAAAIKSQKTFFKLLVGEVLGHYPYGKVFLCDDLAQECEKFELRQKTSCGLILGKKAFASRSQIEDEIFAPYLDLAGFANGSRRFAWEWARDLGCEFDPQNAHFTIHFELQKGCYATNVLREILACDPSPL